ncbi:UbiA family prenyltransferase [Streptomyces marincola]|uniref:UbiA family prenyltransferase n=1 Tax=Streptomyces marincola TaxID=2878388 RepID=UPI001CF1F133|nr:UbiA family prenyltransferase [Streptomyces marincola]UCM89222.1 UbiA family prenyltransferase [Streptomyces marincola]
MALSTDRPAPTRARDGADRPARDGAPEGAWQLARALWGFSRGTQATLSVAQPLLGALLADPDPPPGRLALCLVACVAGYFAVFAANDLIDARLDRERFACLRAYEGFDIDGAGGRHPLAQGRLSLAAGVAWVALLGSVSLVLWALLHWVCAVLLVVAALLEALYCVLARVTEWKFLLTGVLVACGGCLGWFAMTPAVDRPVLWLFCVWLAAWEIGGRNIVNDWADVEEDVHLGVRTVPLRHGPRVSAALTFGSLAVAAVAGAGMLLGVWPAHGLLGPAATCAMLALSGWALIAPGLRLLRAPGPEHAMALFNRASLYPAAALGIVVAALLARHALPA